MDTGPRDRLRRACKNASLHHALPARLPVPLAAADPLSINGPTSFQPQTDHPSVDAAVAAKPCLSSPRTIFLCSSTRAKKEPHGKATHETRGNNDTTLHCSLPSVFSPLAIYIKVETLILVIVGHITCRLHRLVQYIADSPTRLLSIHHHLLPLASPPFDLAVDGSDCAGAYRFLRFISPWTGLSFLSSRYPKFCILQPFFDSLLIPRPSLCATLSLLSIRKVSKNNTQSSII